MNKRNHQAGLSLDNLPKGYPVLVTGATGSIGREICRALGRLGVPVIMACRSEIKYADVFGDILKELPGFKASFLPLNLNSAASVTDAVNMLDDIKLAGIVNNAGTMERYYSVSPDGPETTMNVNYHNTRLLNQLLLPHVAKGGTIVFTTSLTRRRWRQSHLPSVVTEKNFGQLTTYSLSKAWITHFAIEFEKEGCQDGVRVNCCDPGIVDSSMIHMDRWFDPLADILFRPFIRSPRNGAMPALRALLSPLSGRIFTLRNDIDLR